MKNRNLIVLLAALLAFFALYELSFTYKAKEIEEDAMAYTKGNTAKMSRYWDSTSSKEAWLGKTVSETRQKSLQMGLDLQGGVSATLELNVPELLLNLSENSYDADFRKAMTQASEEAKTSTKDYIDLFETAIYKANPNVKLASPSIFGNASNQSFIKPDMSNAAVMKEVKSRVAASIENSFTVLKNRIDKLGVVQPNIQKLPQKGRILVELPGSDDQERVERMLQGAANLEFWNTYDNRTVYPLLESLNKQLGNPVAAKDSSKTTDTLNKKDSAAEKAKELEKAKQENPIWMIIRPATKMDENNREVIAEGAMIGYAASKDSTTLNKYLATRTAKDILPKDLKFAWGAEEIQAGSRVYPIYALKTTAVVGKPGKAPLTGDHVTDSRPGYTQTGQVEVNMMMDVEGTSIWRQLTADAAKTQACIAITLDGYVYSAPRVQNEIPNGTSSITGINNAQGAIDLSNILKAGKMDASCKIVENVKVGSNIGEEASTKGLMAAGIGFLFVFAFVILYYNTAGIVATMVLLLNLLFLMGVMASIGAVITLPGIAGIVLSIAMAVDASVLLYEKVKELKQIGYTTQDAINESFSFKGAIPAILDSNVTTLITGIILLAFGSGPIKGFGTTLVIGILISLFTSIFLTRVFFDFMLRKGKDIKFSIPATEKLFSDSKFDFVSGRKKFYLLSALVIVAGIVSIAIKGPNFGVDLKGGRSYVVRFQNEANTSDVRAALQKSFPGASNEVKTYGSSNQLRVLLDYKLNDTSATIDKTASDLMLSSISTTKAGKAEIVSSQKVGSTVVDDIQSSALLSILGSIFCIFLYLLLRFGRMEFGVGAILAMLFDAMLVISAFSILNGLLPFSLDIDTAFIAAILTVIGYSINDTVVVFDRIRTYLNDAAYKKSSIETVINAALNSTLNRTVITGLATLGVLLILFIFGGEAIRGFTFAMFIGIISGTYSSLFIATPIVVDIALRKAKNETAHTAETIENQEIAK